MHGLGLTKYLDQKAKKEKNYKHGLIIKATDIAKTMHISSKGTNF